MNVRRRGDGITAHNPDTYDNLIRRPISSKLADKNDSAERRFCTQASFSIVFLPSRSPQRTPKITPLIDPKSIPSTRRNGCALPCVNR